MSESLDPNIGASGLVTLADVRDQILEQFKPKPPHLMDLGDVLDEIGTQATWVVDRLAAEGDSTILTAMPGVGKSWYAQQLALCVAMGKDFLGRKVQQGLVIYFAFEGYQQTTRRLHALGLPRECENFKMWIDGTDGSAPAMWLEKVIATRRPKLIILDCLQHVAQSKEGNSYSEAYKLLGPLTQYASRLRMHVLALHHSSAKEEKGGGVGAAIGSTGIPAAFGTVLHLRRLDPDNTDGSTPRVLSCSKHRMGVMGIEDVPSVILAANAFNGRLMVLGSVRDVKQQMIGAKIIEAVTEAVEPMPRSELMKIAETRKATFESVLARLLKAGAVVRTGAGVKTDKHLFGPGPMNARGWEALFRDAGAVAFEPPPIPTDKPADDASEDPGF